MGGDGEDFYFGETLLRHGCAMLYAIVAWIDFVFLYENELLIFDVDV